MRRFSLGLNVLLSAFILWYFVIHVGVESYYKRYVLRAEDFLEDYNYQAKVDRYEELNNLLSKEEEYHVFVGDSRIEQFPMDELYPCEGFLNRGIGFDTTTGLERRLERNVNNIKMASCIVLIGRNDLRYRGVTETVDRIDKIMRAIKARKRYFIGLLPGVEDEYAEGIQAINKAMKEKATRGEFIYIDLSNEFVGAKGEIEEELYYDGVHLTVVGFERMARGLGEYLKSER